MTPEQHARLEGAKQQAADRLRADDPQAAQWLERAAVRVASRAQEGEPDDAFPHLVLSAPGGLSPNSDLALELTGSELGEADGDVLSETIADAVRQAVADGRLKTAPPDRD